MQKNFSILIPTLNEESNLPKLLRCLKNQTLQDFEVIHIDANSTDKTVTAAKSFSKKIDIKTLVVNKKNVCFQRNFGAKKAQGKWLIFMDADIEFDKNMLADLKQKISSKKCDIFVTFYKPDIKKIKYFFLTSLANFLTFILQKSKHPFATEAMFGVKAKVFNNLGGFDETIKVNEGKYFIHKARKNNYKYVVFSSPKYINSMRRAETFGFYSLMKNNIILAIKIALGKKMTSKNVKNRYKMEGGSTYQN